MLCIPNKYSSRNHFGKQFGESGHQIPTLRWLVGYSLYRQAATHFHMYGAEPYYATRALYRLCFPVRSQTPTGLRGMQPPIYLARRGGFCRFHDVPPPYHSTRISTSHQQDIPRLEGPPMILSRRNSLPSGAGCMFYGAPYMHCNPTIRGETCLLLSTSLLLWFIPSTVSPDYDGYILATHYQPQPDLHLPHIRLPWYTNVLPQPLLPYNCAVPPCCRYRPRAPLL